MHFVTGVNLFIGNNNIVYSRNDNKFYHHHHKYYSPCNLPNSSITNNKALKKRVFSYEQF